MIILRKHLLPSVLALVLLSASACTPGTPSDSPSSAAASKSAKPAKSAIPSASVPQVEPVSAVDARTVLAAFKSRDMVGHMQALQRVADANGGNRASGTSGYEESARYVEEQLRAAGYAPVRQTFTFRGEGRGKPRVESFNILADTGGSAGHTVVVGAHLDSVQEGPGINDNGSGVAAVLETARWLQEAGITPANRVRFAFWGGEEDGLWGPRPTACGPCLTGTARISAMPARPGQRRSRTSCSATSRKTGCPLRPRPLTAAPTTAPSSRPAFPAVGCSPGRFSK